MTDIAIQKAKLPDKLIFACALALLFVAAVFAVYTVFPVHADAHPPETWGFSVDWKGCIRPDIAELFSGISPYGNGCGLQPPWMYLALSPLVLLAPALGAAVMFVLTYAGYAFALHKLGAKPMSILLFSLNPLVFFNARNGNVDWLPVIGFVLPSRIGLFFVLVKPQLGAGLALFWLVEAWRKGGIREVVRVFAPVSIAYLLSFAIFGLWPLGYLNKPVDTANASLFPVLVPLGVALLWFALRKRMPHLAMASTPFLSPYLTIHSYAVTLFALKLDPVHLAVLTGLLWVIFH